MLKSLTVIVVLACVAGASIAAQSSSSPAPRVFVFTAEPKSDPPTAEEQGRLDSVKDVCEALSHKAGLNMVSSASEAMPPT